MPKVKKNFMTDAEIDDMLTELGTVYCPSCKSEDVHMGMTKNDEIADKLFNLNLYYNCKKCQRYWMITMNYTREKGG